MSIEQLYKLRKAAERSSLRCGQNSQSFFEAVQRLAQYLSVIDNGNNIPADIFLGRYAKTIVWKAVSSEVPCTHSLGVMLAIFINFDVLVLEDSNMKQLPIDIFRRVLDLMKYSDIQDSICCVSAVNTMMQQCSFAQAQELLDELFKETRLSKLFDRIVDSPKKDVQWYPGSEFTKFLQFSFEMIYTIIQILVNTPQRLLYFALSLKKYKYLDFLVKNIVLLAKDKKHRVVCQQLAGQLEQLLTLSIFVAFVCDVSPIVDMLRKIKDSKTKIVEEGIRLKIEQSISPFAMLGCLIDAEDNEEAYETLKDMMGIWQVADMITAFELIDFAALGVQTKLNKEIFLTHLRKLKQQKHIQDKITRCQHWRSGCKNAYQQLCDCGQPFLPDLHVHSDSDSDQSRKKDLQKYLFRNSSIDHKVLIQDLKEIGVPEEFLQEGYIRLMCDIYANLGALDADGLEVGNPEVIKKLKKKEQKKGEKNGFKEDVFMDIVLAWFVRMFQERFGCPSIGSIILE